jgi:hypothetical protein
MRPEKPADPNALGKTGHAVMSQPDCIAESVGMTNTIALQGPALEQKDMRSRRCKGNQSPANTLTPSRNRDHAFISPLARSLRRECWWWCNTGGIGWTRSMGCLDLRCLDPHVEPLLLRLLRHLILLLLLLQLRLPLPLRLRVVRITAHCDTPLPTVFKRRRVVKL